MSAAIEHLVITSSGKCSCRKSWSLSQGSAACKHIIITTLRKNQCWQYTWSFGKCSAAIEHLSVRTCIDGGCWKLRSIQQRRAVIEHVAITTSRCYHCWKLWTVFYASRFKHAGIAAVSKRCCWKFWGLCESTLLEKQPFKAICCWNSAKLDAAIEQTHHTATCCDLSSQNETIITL